jgi:hypothetical protein
MPLTLNTPAPIVSPVATCFQIINFGATIDTNTQKLSEMAIVYEAGTSEGGIFQSLDTRPRQINLDETECNNIFTANPTMLPTIVQILYAAIEVKEGVTGTAT